MKLNAEIVKALPIPEVGNRIHYFAEAVRRQGAARVRRQGNSRGVPGRS